MSPFLRHLFLHVCTHAWCLYMHFRSTCASQAAALCMCMLACLCVFASLKVDAVFFAWLCVCVFMCAHVCPSSWCIPITFAPPPCVIKSFGPMSPLFSSSSRLKVEQWSTREGVGAWVIAILFAHVWDLSTGSKTGNAYGCAFYLFIYFFLCEVAFCVCLSHSKD